MMVLYTLGMAGLGLAFLPLVMIGQGYYGQLAFQGFLWGSLLSGFVANYLIMQTVRR